MWESEVANGEFHCGDPPLFSGESFSSPSPLFFCKYSRIAVLTISALVLNPSCGFFFW